MKTTILFLSLLLSVNLYAQRDKGKTYALIVGISDYNDEKITDLDFAHRDADAFSDYLQSKAGGTVPSENIMLLTNSNATNGAIYDAFFKLSKKVKKKDRVFFYFSGHGDVENDTIYNLGFLLAWDTPYNCYRNNAVALEDINREAARLSVNRGAEVVYILDACRSGALAGDANNGRKLANDQMQKRFAKEVRIMSCESNQKSLEHPDLGGGRGIFSYFLIRGLIGKAERAGREDYQISLKEIRNYLEDRVSEEAKEYNRFQDPFVEGNRNFRLSKVDEEALQALIDRDSSRTTSGLFSSRSIVGAVAINSKTANENKHAKNLIEAVKNSGLLEHHDFIAKIKSEGKDLYRYLFKQLKEPEYQSKLTQAQKNAIQYFRDNSKDYVNNEEWQQNMNQLMAITLNDLAQQVINSYLQTDRKEMEKRNYTNTGEGMEIYLTLMSRALEILPEDHPINKSLKIKYHYFNGLVKRLSILKLKDMELVNLVVAEAMEQQSIAYQLDKQAPYIHNELGVLNSILGNKEKAKQYYLKASKLAPTWAIPYSNLSSIHNSKGMYDIAINYADTSINLRADFSIAWLQLGSAYLYKKDLLKAEEYFLKASSLDDVAFHSLERLAHTYLSLNDYKQAEEYFVMVDKRKGIYKEKIKQFDSAIRDNNPDEPETLAYVGASSSNYSSELASNPELEKRMEESPKDIQPILDYARFQIDNGHHLAAIYYCQKAIDIDSVHMEANLMIAELFNQISKAEDAFTVYSRLYELFPDEYDVFVGLANTLFYKLNNSKDAIPLYEKALLINRYDTNVNRALAKIYYEKKQFEKANIYFERIDYEDWDNFSTLFTRAKLYHEWGRYEQAERFYLLSQNKASQDSERENVQTKLFNLYSKLHRYFEAESALKSYATSDSIEQFYINRVNQFINNSYWKYQLAELQFSNLRYLEKEKKEALLKSYHQLIELDSSYRSLPHLYVHMAGIYSKLDSTETANAYFTKAIKLDPANVETYFKIIDLYFKNFKKSKAMEYLIHLDTSNLLDTESRYQLANLLTGAGRFTEAQQALDRIQEIHPYNWFDMYKSYGHLYMLSDKNTEAIKQYQLSYKKNYQSKIDAYSLARLYAKEGKIDLAFDWLDTAIAKGFDYDLVLEYDPLMESLRIQRSEAFKLLRASIHDSTE